MIRIKAEEIPEKLLEFTGQCYARDEFVWEHLDPEVQKSLIKLFGDIVNDLGSYEEGRERGYDEGYDGGYNEGYFQGEQTGLDRGYDEGYDRGYEDGYEAARRDT